jgi:hypothetical protein
MTLQRVCFALAYMQRHNHWNRFIGSKTDMVFGGRNFDGRRKYSNVGHLVVPGSVLLYRSSLPLQIPAGDTWTMFGPSRFPTKMRLRNCDSFLSRLQISMECCVHRTIWGETFPDRIGPNSTAVLDEYSASPMIVSNVSGVGSLRQPIPSERKGNHPSCASGLCWLLTTSHVGCNRYTLIISNCFDTK